MLILAAKECSRFCLLVYCWIILIVYRKTFKSIHSKDWYKLCEYHSHSLITYVLKISKKYNKILSNTFGQLHGKLHPICMLTATLLILLIFSLIIFIWQNSEKIYQIEHSVYLLKVSFTGFIDSHSLSKVFLASRKGKVSIHLHEYACVEELLL